MIEVSQNVIQWMNLGMIVFFAIFIISGAKKGFFLSFVTMVGSIISLFVSWRYCGVASEYFKIWPKEFTPFKDLIFFNQVHAYLNRIAWFVVLFLVAKFVFYLLEQAISSLQDSPVIKEVSVLFGGVLGGLIASIWVIVICVVLRLPIFENGNAVIQNTWLHYIPDTTNAVLYEFGIDEMGTDIMNELYLQYQTLDDSDQQALRTWLDQHGFEAKS